jgi:hypothetical protein
MERVTRLNKLTSMSASREMVVSSPFRVYSFPETSVSARRRKVQAL